MSVKKAIEILNTNLERDDSCLADATKEVKEQYLTLCLAITQALAELQQPEPNECKTCSGIGLIHSGEPTMYNCELGGDCSEDPNWTEDQCKACGKTVPCPECKPEANKYYLLWQRDCKEMNLAKQEIDRLNQRVKELEKERKRLLEDCQHFIKERNEALGIP